MGLYKVRQILPIIFFAVAWLVGCSETVPEFTKLDFSSQYISVDQNSTKLVSSFAEVISISGTCLSEFHDIEIQGGGMSVAMISSVDSGADLDCSGDGKFSFTLNEAVVNTLFTGLASEVVELKLKGVVDSVSEQGSSQWGISFAPVDTIIVADPTNGTDAGSGWDVNNGWVTINNLTNSQSTETTGVTLLGLVGHWKMDSAILREGPGVLLESVNGLNGSIVTNQGTFDKSVVGRLDGGLFFDGFDDYAVMALDPSLQMTSQITLAAWIRPQSCCVAGGARVISKRTQAGGQDVVSLVLDSGSQLSFEFHLLNISGVPHTLSSDTEINLGRWQFVVATFDGSVMKLYINGVEDRNSESGATSIIYNSTNPFVLGAREGEGLNFHGDMDEVSIWDRALTGAEIEKIYGVQSAVYNGTYISEVIDGGAIRNWQTLSWIPTQPISKALPPSIEIGYETGAVDMSNLQFLMRFDETSLGSVDQGTADFLDRSSFSRHGQSVGGALTTEKGKFGRALGLDGVDDCVSVGVFEAAGSFFSASAWIFPTADKNFHRRILSKSPDTAPENHIWMMSTYPVNSGLGLRVRLKTGSSLAAGTTTLLPSSANISLNQWNHVAMTYDGAILKTFVNGILMDSTSKTGTVTASDRPVMIGCSADLIEFFQGRIDEVVIWNRAVTDAEIENLYLRGAHHADIQLRACNTPTCSDNPPFVGPGGIENSYFNEQFNDSTGLPALPIGGTLLPSRYIQYKLDLNSDDSDSIPKIREVTVQGGS